MKNSSKTLLVLIAILLLACATSSNIERENQENDPSQSSESIHEDYWPFSKTLSTHDPFVSELLESEKH